MRIILRFTMIFILILNCLKLNAQIWPFGPLFRFGNTVYYSIDSLSENKLTGTNISFDKKLTDRFFDVNLKTDRLGIKINDSIIYFNHRNRNEPKCYQELVFYSKRNLINPNFKIKYLKLIETNDSSLIAQATILKRYDNKKTMDTFKINKSDINGVFLGAGKKTRRFYTTFTIAVCFSALIYNIAGLK
jgi:hypothetical protein